MACLSWRSGDPNGPMTFTGAANPIFILTDLSAPPWERIEFEVLEDDAGALAARVGSVHFFSIDDRTGVFTAKIGALIPVSSTHPGLALLAERRVLSGYLEIIETSQAAS